MKAINYKMKRLKRFDYSSKKPSRPAIIQNKYYVYKKKVKYDKNRILDYFFFC